MKPLIKDCYDCGNPFEVRDPDSRCELLCGDCQVNFRMSHPLNTKNQNDVLYYQMRTDFWGKVEGRRREAIRAFYNKE